MMSFYLLCLFVLLISILGTWLLRCSALKYFILIDKPNQRSSHSIATPRGGGLAVAVAFILGAIYTAYIQKYSIFYSVLGSCFLVALIGFIDDLKGLSVWLRMFTHAAVAGFILYNFNGFPPIEIFGLNISGFWFCYGLGVVAIVWMINLFNFMDGIDGIAAVQAMSVCLGGAFFYFILGVEDKVQLPLLLACAILGFTVFNFPPASIFMGDSGSGFLGLMLALFTLQAAWVDIELLWVWLVLNAVFITDATVTLLCRLVGGNRIYVPHRTHAYQVAAGIFKNHLPVTLIVALINFLWLIPLAGMMLFNVISLFSTILFAYIPLVILVFYLRKKI